MIQYRFPIQFVSFKRYALVLLLTLLTSIPQVAVARDFEVSLIAGKAKGGQSLLIKQDLPDQLKWASDNLNNARFFSSLNVTTISESSVNWYVNLVTLRHSETGSGSKRYCLFFCFYVPANLLNSEDPATSKIDLNNKSVQLGTFWRFERDQLIVNPGIGLSVHNLSVKSFSSSQTSQDEIYYLVPRVALEVAFKINSQIRLSYSFNIGQINYKDYFAEEKGSALEVKYSPSDSWSLGLGKLVHDSIIKDSSIEGELKAPSRFTFLRISKNF